MISVPESNGLSQQCVTTPTAVSVLGLGFMGTAIAKAFIEKGHAVHVWNRSAQKAEALASLGATVSPTAEECIQASDIVVSVLTGDKAFEAVLKTIGPSAGAGRTVVNFGTGSPSQVRQCMEVARQCSFDDYIHASMLALPSGVGLPATVALYSGSGDAFERVRGTVAALAQPRYLKGGDITSAAVQEVVLSTVYYMASAGYIQAIALLKRSGMWSPGTIEKFTKDFVVPNLHDVAESLVDLARQIDKGEYFSNKQGCRLTNHAASLRNFVRTYSELDVTTFGLEPFAGIMEERISQGGQDEEMSSMVEIL